MNEKYIENRVIEHVQKFYGHIAGITVERSTSIEQLGLDSLDLTELVIHIERDFGITINDEIWDSLDTVEKVIEAVWERLKP